MDELALLKEQIATLMADKRHAQEEAFLNRHGASFNNDRDIGLAALTELERRGIDTSVVTNEAVENLMNEFRMQIAQLSDQIGMTRQTLNQQQSMQAELLDKADQIDKAVQSASGNPEMSDLGMAAPAPMPEASAPMPEMPAPATETPAPQETPVTESPAVQEAPMSEEAPAPDIEPPIPSAVQAPEVAKGPAKMLSDRNKKFIQAARSFASAQHAVSDSNMKNIQAPKSTKPAAGILRACMARW